MKLPPMTLCTFALLAACSTVPDADAMNIDYKKDGAFSGSAGASWTAEDIKGNALVDICKGTQKLTDFKIARDANGTATFSGKCTA